MRRFRAGCARECEGPDDLAEIAYTVLGFPECSECGHRLEPEGAPSFCRWLQADRPHPFAGLAGLREGLE